MKKRNLFWIVSILIVSSVLSVSCQPPAENEEAEGSSTASDAAAESGSETAAEEPENLVFTDDLGNVLEFTEYPSAIVSISPSMTETLYAIGAGGQLVGRDETSTFPEEAQQVPSVGALWGELPTEAILALEPDLVLAAEIISAETVTALQELGLQVYWQANPDTFEDLFDNLRDIASLTGHQQEVQPLIDDLSTRVAAVDEIVPGAESTPSVFYELDATDPSNPWTTGTGTFIDYLINKARAVNVAAEVEGDYAAFSVEQLIQTDPDIILLGDAIYGITPESVGERAGWDAITAVQSGMVYGIDPNIVSVPGPRLVDGYEVMAKLIHPELFD